MQLWFAVFVKNGPLYTVAHTNISGATPEAIRLSPVRRGGKTSGLSLSFFLSVFFSVSFPVN